MGLALALGRLRLESRRRPLPRLPPEVLGSRPITQAHWLRLGGPLRLRQESRRIAYLVRPHALWHCSKLHLIRHSSPYELSPYS